MAYKEEDVVNEIFSMYETIGKADYLGEPVSQLEHMSQAAQLAILEGFDDEVVLACFFHDIGNLCVIRNHDNTMGDYGVKDHEAIGASFLREKGFPERVIQLVSMHTKAKRYLVFKYPEYMDQLSDASKATLEYQGGMMDEKEAVEFEASPLFMLSLLMRKWDEMAKEIHVPLIDLNIVKQVMMDVLIKNNKSAFTKSEELLNSI